MYALLLLLIVAIVELVLSGTWNRSYFRFGIPIFLSRVDARSLRPDVEQVLATSFSGRLAPALAFERFSATEIAFREKAWSFSWFHYTPVMHGLLRYVPEEGKVHVVGLLNWFVVPFIAVFAWAFHENFEWEFAAFLAGLLGLLYAIQAFRFARVGRRLAQSAA